MKHNVPSLRNYIFLLFVVACLMVVLRGLPQLDFIVWLQSNETNGSIRIFQVISDSITFFSLGVPLAISISKEFDKNANQRNSRLSFVYVGLSVGIAGLISYIIKHIGSIPRPFQVDARIIQLSGGGGFSFPSGHTTEAFAAATAFLFLIPKRNYFLIFFFWASLVGFSRVYLGVHYPIDVLGGIAIGVSVSYALQFVFRMKTGIFNAI